MASRSRRRQQTADLPIPCPVGHPVWVKLTGDGGGAWWPGKLLRIDEVYFWSYQSRCNVTRATVKPFEISHSLVKFTRGKLRCAEDKENFETDLKRALALHQKGTPDTVSEGSDTKGNPDTVSEGNDTKGNPGTVSEGNDTKGNPDTVSEGNDTKGNPDTVSEGNDTKGNPDTVSEGNDSKGNPDTVSEGNDTKGNADTVSEGKLMLIQDFNAVSKFKGKSIQEISVDEIIQEGEDFVSGNSSDIEAALHQKSQENTEMESEETPEAMELEEIPQTSRPLPPKEKKATKQRVKWTCEEIEEVEKLFQDNLKNGKCPGFKEVKKCIAISKTQNGLIHNRQWETIKKKVWNLIQKKK
ncbi:uncharacterized protein LOC117338903 [Pecten maximus]|uniref:uncharacterized protein LOC117338903 n=2 Tax=Pecten maximus TaxID=6579 RepID=UPI001458003E|nr:uncharacterized protein LOC117338903 [Pecten maximus]